MITATSSPDWAVRSRAGQDLTGWAERRDVAELLLRLLLDEYDTAVTDSTGQALLNRNDIHGVRLIAKAITTADDEYLDHLHATVANHLTPTGPVTQFLGLCAELAQDPDLTIRTGAAQLHTWAAPWASTP